MGLTPDNQKQFTLFSNENPKHHNITAVVDRLNRTYGNNKIKFAAQSLGRQWKMKQEKLSSRYTTNFKEVITINT